MRVPCESMRKTFKSTQRHLERNIDVLKTTSQSLVIKTNNGGSAMNRMPLPSTTSSSASMTPFGEDEEIVNKMELDVAVAAEAAAGHSESAEVLGQIDTMIGRVKGLKRKISSLREEHESSVGKAKARIDFLSKLYEEDVTDVESEQYKHWTKTRLDMLLIDYCMRNGQPQTATQLAKVQGIEKLVDIEELQQCIEIEQSLRVEHSTARCQQWCQENRQFLKKTRSNLEFQIKLQSFIEFARDRNFTGAIEYYRQHLIKNADSKFELMQQASALLAFDPSDSVKPYSDLYSTNRWHEIADMFVQTFQEMHGLPHRSLFLQYLATGITALKTYSCEIPAEDEETELDRALDAEPALETNSNLLPSFLRKHKVDLTRGYMCPVCSVELRRIAQPLPYALHVHSHLDPDPVLLPNNRIYGLAKLLDYAKKAGVAENKIVDPVTTEVFDRDSTTIVYPS